MLRAKIVYLRCVVSRLIDSTRVASEGGRGGRKELGAIKDASRQSKAKYMEQTQILGNIMWYRIY